MSYHKKRFWAGFLLAQFLFFYIASKFEFAVDLAGRFFEFQKDFHQKIFASAAFSIGDLLYIFIGILSLYYIIKFFSKKCGKYYLLQFLIFLNVSYFLYQILWGMLYFQKPIFGDLPKEKITVEETKALAIKYLNLCRKSRMLVAEDRNGVFKFSPSEDIENEILRNQRILPSFIRQKAATNNNAFKPSLFREVMSYTGILGYYNPFTAEAQYNSNLPSSYIPFTLAHESAHQLGYAREQEANFIAYLLGIKSEKSSLRYSTEYFVLKSSLRALSDKDPQFVKYVLRNYSVGMKRDRLAEKMFAKKHEGFFNQLFGFTNDLFLKSNQQDGSITYSYFINLLNYYEKNYNLK